MITNGTYSREFELLGNEEREVVLPNKDIFKNVNLKTAKEREVVLPKEDIFKNVNLKNAYGDCIVERVPDRGWTLIEDLHFFNSKKKRGG